MINPFRKQDLKRALHVKEDYISSRNHRRTPKPTDDQQRKRSIRIIQVGIRDKYLQTIIAVIEARWRRKIDDTCGFGFSYDLLTDSSGEKLFPARFGVTDRK